MGRPLGSKNRSSAPVVQAQVASDVSTQTASSGAGSGEIKRTYKEGAAVIEIPKSNSTAALFPEFMPAPDTTEPAPQAQPEPENVPRETIEPEQDSKPEPEVTPVEEEPISEPRTEESFDLDDLLKEMHVDPSKVRVKTKVDGVETYVPIVDVKKSYQLEQHLTKRGQKIGEERRQLEALRQELAAKSQPAPQESSTGDPQYDALRQELDQLKSIIPSIQPVIYQTARQQLANELKEQGFPDFMDYIDKIDARVGAETDDNKWRYYNTKDGAKQLYFQMKLEDQMKGTPAKKPEPVKSQPRPPVVKIDGGNQPSRPVVDDVTTKYNELITEWKKNPARNKHLLPEILRMKGALFIQ